LSPTGNSDYSLFYIIHRNLSAITNQRSFVFDGAIVEDTIELWDFAVEDRPADPQQASMAMNFLARVPPKSFPLTMPRPFRNSSSIESEMVAYVLKFSSWAPFSVQPPQTASTSSSLMLRIIDLKLPIPSVRYLVIPEHINFTVVLQAYQDLRLMDNLSVFTFKLSLRKVNEHATPCVKKNVFFLSRPRRNYPELFSQLGFTGDRLESLRKRNDVIEFQSTADDIYVPVKTDGDKRVLSSFRMKITQQKILSAFAHSFKKSNKRKVNCVILELDTQDPQVAHFINRPPISSTANPGVAVTKEPFYTALVKEDFHTCTTLGYVRDSLVSINLATLFPYTYKMYSKNFLLHGSFVYVPDSEAKKLDDYLLCTGMDNVPKEKMDFLRAYDSYRINRKTLSLAVPLTEMALLIDALFLLVRFPQGTRLDFIHNEKSLVPGQETLVLANKEDGSQFNVQPSLLDVDRMLSSFPQVNHSGSISFLQFLQLHPEFLPPHFRLNLIVWPKTPYHDRWCIWLVTGVAGKIPDNGRMLAVQYRYAKEKVAKKKFSTSEVETPRSHPYASPPGFRRDTGGFGNKTEN
jgi:hypothetical protein